MEIIKQWLISDGYTFELYVKTSDGKYHRLIHTNRLGFEAVSREAMSKKLNKPEMLKRYK